MLAHFFSALKITSSDNIKVDALTSSDHFFVELKELNSLSKSKKVSFINDMINKHSSDLLTFKETESGSSMAKKVSFNVMKNLNYTYAKGILPVKVNKLKSFDGFYVDLTVNHISDELGSYSRRVL